MCCNYYIYNFSTIRLVILQERVNMEELLLTNIVWVISGVGFVTVLVVGKIIDKHIQENNVIRDKIVEQFTAKYDKEFVLLSKKSEICDKELEILKLADIEHKKDIENHDGIIVRLTVTLDKLADNIGRLKS